MKDGTASLTEIECLRMRVDALYTPLDEAVEELVRRRKRFNGITPGREWLPPSFPVEQHAGAFLFRFIATPNFETWRFLQLAGECDLLPVIGEYHRDRYASCNPIKHALLRPGFVLEKNTAINSNSLVEHVKIVGKHPAQLCDMRTRWGQSLIGFHHEMFASTLNGVEHPLLNDCSQRYADAGASPAAYYADFLRVAITDGILFEDFLLDETERRFTRDVVLPAVDEVTARFGLRPLIVRLTSPEEEASPHWFWYPAEMKPFVQQRLTPRETREGEAPAEPCETNTSVVPIARREPRAPGFIHE